MKILVLGGAGQLGTEFLLQRPASASASAPTSGRARCSQRGEAAGQQIVAEQPDVVVNFSAFHVLEECERSFRDALDVNAASVFEMARSSDAIGARFLTISTDYVFDGRSAVPYLETDAALPLQAYGVSKRAGEVGSAGRMRAVDRDQVLRHLRSSGQQGTRRQLRRAMPRGPFSGGGVHRRQRPPMHAHIRRRSRPSHVVASDCGSIEPWHLSLHGRRRLLVG